MMLGIVMLVSASGASAVWIGPGDYILFNHYLEAPSRLSSGKTQVERFLLEGPFVQPAACFAEMQRLNRLVVYRPSATGFSCERLKRADGIIDSPKVRALILGHDRH